MIVVPADLGLETTQPLPAGPWQGRQLGGAGWGASSGRTSHRTRCSSRCSAPPPRQLGRELQLAVRSAPPASTHRQPSAPSDVAAPHLNKHPRPVAPTADQPSVTLSHSVPRPKRPRDVPARLLPPASGAEKIAFCRRFRRRRVRDALGRLGTSWDVLGRLDVFVLIHRPDDFRGFNGHSDQVPRRTVVVGDLDQEHVGPDLMDGAPGAGIPAANRQTEFDDIKFGDHPSRIAGRTGLISEDLLEAQRRRSQASDGRPRVRSANRSRPSASRRVDP